MSLNHDLREISGYKVIEPIAQDSTGIVFRVERNGCFFALKLLKPSSAADTFRLRREVASIARLNHPNLTKIVDANELEGVPFIVMELPDGKTLSEAFAAGPMPEAQVIRVGESVASALAELHRFRMVHGAIKPANINISQSGVIKLQGPGLTSDVSEYSSPEETKQLKRPIDGRADLYSLGAMLFQCLTGQAPFESDDRGKLVLKASPGLAAIIDRLLQKDPDYRYQSAEGLRYDLANLTKIDQQFRSKGTLALGKRDCLVGTGDFPLFGREQECNKLKSFLDGAYRSLGRAAIIEGEVGSGKSRLIREVIGMASRETCFLLRGKCHPLSSQMPLAPLRDAFDTFFDELKTKPAGEREAMVNQIKISGTEFSSSLCKLSRSFKEVFGDAPTKSSGDAEVDRQRFLDDLSSFLIRFSGSGCGALSLVIDDIQWIDPMTTALLAKLCPRIADQKILVLLSSRNDDANAGKLQSFKDTIGEPLAEPIVLYTLPDVQGIVSSQLGASSLDPAAVHKIASQTNGNPLRVTEYVRSLLNSGYMSFAGGKWIVDPTGFSTISLSRDVFESALNRIQSANEKTRSILSFAAVIGDGFDLELISGASGLGIDDVIECMQESARQNLVAASGGTRFSFTHDRIRESVSSALSPEKLREINDRLARFADTRSGSDKSWFDLARFYAHGNVELHRKRAFETSYEAGKIALANFSYQQAHDLLDFAFKNARECGIDQKTLVQIARSLAVASTESGNEKSAHEAIDFALSCAETKEEIIDLSYIRLRCYRIYGRINHVWIVYKQLLELLGEPHPRYPFSIFTKANWLLLSVGMKFILGWGFGSACSNPKKLKRLKLLSAVHLAGSQVSQFTTSRGAILISLRLLASAYQLGNSPLFARALCMTANICSAHRLQGIASFLLARAHQVADSVDDPSLKAYVRFAETQNLFLTDDNSFEKSSDEVATDVRRFLGPFENAIWVMYRAMRISNKGHSKEAVEFIELHLPRIERLGQRFFVGTLRTLLSYHLNHLGQTQAAATTKRLAQEIIDRDLKDLSGSLRFNAMFHLLLAYEQRDWSNQTGLLLDLLESIPPTSYPHKIMFAIVAYVRLAQLERIEGEEEQRRARLELKSALRKFFFKAYDSTHRCHWHIISAGLYRLEGKHKKALRHIERGYQLARTIESDLCIYFASMERAKIYKRDGDRIRMEGDAAICLSICRSEDWSIRAGILSQEIGIPKIFSSGSTGETDLSPTSAVSGSVPRHEKRAR